MGVGVVGGVCVGGGRGKLHQRLPKRQHQRVRLNSRKACSIRDRAAGRSHQISSPKYTPTSRKSVKFHRHMMTLHTPNSNPFSLYRTVDLTTKNSHTLRYCSKNRKRCVSLSLCGSPPSPPDTNTAFTLGPVLALSAGGTTTDIVALCHQRQGIFSAGLFRTERSCERNLNTKSKCLWCQESVY